MRISIRLDGMYYSSSNMAGKTVEELSNEIITTLQDENKKHFSMKLHENSEGTIIMGRRAIERAVFTIRDVS